MIRIGAGFTRFFVLKSTELQVCDDCGGGDDYREEGLDAQAAPGQKLCCHFARPGSWRERGGQGAGQGAVVSVYVSLYMFYVSLYVPLHVHLAVCLCVIPLYMCPYMCPYMSKRATLPVLHSLNSTPKPSP